MHLFIETQEEHGTPGVSIRGKKKKKRKKSKLPAACIYLIVDMQTQHKEVGIYIGC